MGGNQALNINSAVGQHADLQITVHGSDWYFAVCAIMGASTLVFAGLAAARPPAHRLFHHLTAAITAVACVAYFSMGSDLGQLPVQAGQARPRSAAVAAAAAGTREVFWARYADWFVTTPLLLADLLLTAGAPWPAILATLLADEAMVAAGLAGALTPTGYKWGYWVFGVAAFLLVAYELAVDARRRARARGPAVEAAFLRCGVLTLLVWLLYPIAWGVAEGGNVVHPDSEAVFYGVLDILAKPGFGFLLLFGHNDIDPADLGLVAREPGGAGAGAGAVSEKGHGTGAAEAGHNGANNGTNNNV